MKRLPIIAALAVLATLWTAPNAWAHTELIASDPAKDAQVATAPQQLTLTFSEPIDPTLAKVTVAGADGTAWTVGVIAGSGATLTVPVTPAGPAGLYTISYTITSADGDPVTGTVAFTLTTAVPTPTTTTTTTTTTAPAESSAAPDPAAQPTDAGDGGLPAWVWIVLGLVVVAVIVVGLLVRRSGSRPTDAP